MAASRLFNAIVQVVAKRPTSGMHNNFCRIHKTLRVTPAMAAGATDHVWSIEELVNLIPEPVAKKRGPYKKRVDQPEAVQVAA